MADIAVITYFSIVVFNPLYWEEMSDIFKELPTLLKYTKDMRHAFGLYFEVRPAHFV